MGGFLSSPQAGAGEPVRMSVTASRHAVSGDQADAYVENLASRFAIKSRATDPFGRAQDPAMAAALVRPLHDPNPKQTSKVPTTPFPDVVAAIGINTIDLSKRRFFVGAREFRQNSVLNLRLASGKMVRAQVSSITSKSVIFRNPETGESAIKQLPMMPAGMDRGAPPENEPQPGMERLGPASIEIQTQPSLPPADRIIPADHPLNFIAAYRPSK